MSSQSPSHSTVSAAHAQRRHHQSVLALACGVVALSFLLQVRDDQRVEFQILPGYPLPHLCLSRLTFDVQCPGCGLTRSFIHLAHLDWQASYSVHRLGWLLALAVWVQIPFRLFALYHKETLAPRITKSIGFTFIALIILNWLLGMIL